MRHPRAFLILVVGIGASAGGLEAFIEFFEAMPAEQNIAFVLVQHLSPKRQSLIAEILAKHTSMPVLEVEDGMAVKPNHVYIIRPGHTMTIREGHLHLGESLVKPGNNRPVDDFFRSLAEEQRERAVCIILSGMGSNGTAGAQEIKVVGGICIAQEPESAKFPSMPRSLIETNLADFILKPAEMPALLQRYATHDYVTGERPAATVTRPDATLIGEILAILRARTRHDFTGYKKPTVVRRIHRRMGLTQHATMADYARTLRQTPVEVTNLADDLMIHVTGFFRDPGVWETLRETVIRPLIADRADQSSIRAWVTACATGEEAYTLAMLLVEAAEAADKQFDIKVFATDMAERALVHARAGNFPGGIETEVSPARLARFFDKDETMYRVKRDLRERVVFAPQNVLQDPPFSRLDIATCRNLLIYLEAEVQERVLALLHFGLRDGGVLVLGNSETVGDREEMFETVDKKNRLYKRVGPTRHGMIDFPPPRSHDDAARRAGMGEPRVLSRAMLTQVTNKALLDHHTPPAVVVDRGGRIIFFHGRTEAYLEQPGGEPTRDIMELARQSIRGPIRVALHRAMESGEAVAVKDGVHETDDGPHRVEVTAAPLDSRTPAQYFLISFDSYPILVAAASTNKDGPADLAEELRSVRSELQSTVEELQTSNEEMKASHEEVTSINEELQSTNEELETSKEELQSLNEELTTVNAQLQAKMDELQQTSNDLTSLLTSTDIAVIFLDTRLRIRRYTQAVKLLMDIIPADAGRPFSDLARKFDDADLMADAAAVLERLVPIEKEIRADDGRSYVRRILPYRTSDNRIGGVVVTFVDVTLRVQTSARLAETARLLDLSSDAIIVRDITNRITYWNNGAHELFGWSAEEAIGQDLHALLKTELEEPLEQLLVRLRETDGLSGEIVQVTRDGQHLTLLCRWSLDRTADGTAASILTSTTDITNQKEVMAVRRAHAEQQKLILEGVQDHAIFQIDLDRRIVTWTPAAESILGFTADEAIGQSADIIFTPEDRAAGAPEQEAATALAHQRAIDERWHICKGGGTLLGQRQHDRASGRWRKTVRLCQNLPRRHGPQTGRAGIANQRGAAASGRGRGADGLLGLGPGPRNSDLGRGSQSNPWPAGGADERHVR